MSIFSTILTVFLVLIILSGLFIVKQQSSAIVERFGRFLVVRHPGLHIKIPFIDRIAGRLSLRILELNGFRCMVCQEFVFSSKFRTPPAVPVSTMAWDPPPQRCR